MSVLPPRNAWRVGQEHATPGAASFAAEEGTSTFAVRIVIEQNGFVTGWDEGAMGFEIDAVWFSGHCTSFRLSAYDVLPWTVAGDTGFTAREQTMRRGVPLRHPRRDVWVRVVPLKLPPNLEETLFDELLRIRQRRSVKGPSQFPPLVPRPGARVWRTKTRLLPRTGNTTPLAAFLDRTGLMRLLGSDLSLVRESMLRKALLWEIERE